MDIFVTMKRTERDQISTFEAIRDRDITQEVAANILGLSSRQVRRKLVQYKKFGGDSLIHKGRGKRSNRKIPDSILQEVIQLKKEKYHDFGPTLFSEKLAKYHNIRLDHETIRRMLISNNLHQSKKRRKTDKVWRERKHCFGELVQIDGSEHDWFETGELCTLLAFIDDATGIVELVFAPESTEGLVTITKNYLDKYGRPVALYSDRGKVFKVNNYKGEGETPLTQYGRMIKELGIRMIYASSPQAKGRVERLFGTLQDRLVKEMRLLKIKNCEDANKYLQDEFLAFFNGTFIKAPKEIHDAHRTMQDIKLDSIFCIKKQRILNNDRTIAYQNRWMLLSKKQAVPITPGSGITVNEHFDGTLVLMFKGHRLDYRPIDKASRPPNLAQLPDKTVRDTYHKPSKSHYWNRLAAADFRDKQLPKPDISKKL